jgi:hypothetical protein
VDSKTRQRNEEMNGRIISMIDVNKDPSKYTIFVSIAAFNEIYTQQTLDEALAKADYPDRLHFGI